MTADVMRAGYRSSSVDECITGRRPSHWERQCRPVHCGLNGQIWKSNVWIKSLCHLQGTAFDLLSSSSSSWSRVQRGALHRSHGCVKQLVSTDQLVTF